MKKKRDQKHNNKKLQENLNRKKLHKIERAEDITNYIK